MSDETTRPLPQQGEETTRPLPEQGEDTTRTFADEAPSAAAPPGPAEEPDLAGRPDGAWQPQEPWHPAVEEDTGGRHPLSVAHLVAGLVFLGVAVSWLLRETGVVEAEATGWFLPLTLVVAGAVGLLAWFSSARGKSR
jgi:hypothetical protein